MVLSIVIRYDSVGRANQELVGIHNDAAQEELVELFGLIVNFGPSVL